jgi:hypothetical protein
MGNVLLAMVMDRGEQAVIHNTLLTTPHSQLYIIHCPLYIIHCLY